MFRLPFKLKPLPPLARSVSTHFSGPNFASITAKSNFIHSQITQKCSPIMSTLQQKFTGHSILKEIHEQLSQRPSLGRYPHGSVVLLMGDLARSLPQVTPSAELVQHHEAIATVIELLNLGFHVHAKVIDIPEPFSDYSSDNIPNKLAILFGDYTLGQVLMYSSQFEGSTEILYLISEITKNLSEATFDNVQAESCSPENSLELWFKQQFLRHVGQFAIGCQSVARVAVGDSNEKLINLAFDFGLNFGYFHCINRKIRQTAGKPGVNLLETYSHEYRNKAVQCLEQFPTQDQAKKSLLELLN